LGLEWSALAGSGRSGRIVERDVRRAAASARVASAASPAAETAADPLTAATVEAPAPAVAAPSEMQTVVAATGATTPTPAAPPVGMAEPTVAASSGHQEGQRQPLGGVRQIVAARMAESARTAAPVTLTTDADATDLVRLRQQMAADLAGSDQPLPSYTDCLAKLVAGVLQDLPYMNASLVGSEIVQHAAIHLGLAVDTPRGLLVPVLRDVPGKSLLQVARESAALIERARSGRIAADELRGSTFTITNLGMYEIDAFTPIINLPECAILGVGRIIARPVVLDPATEKISVRQQLALSLTFDHRVVDGAPAARFLQRVKQVIEHPIGWLMR
jgi:pyruvate dehydrogenase E2 component (dihydrolipoamide acetyltransferase)